MIDGKAIHVSRKTLIGIAGIVLVAVLAFQAPQIILALKKSETQPSPSPNKSIASTVKGDRERQQLAAYCEAWSQAMPQVKDFAQFDQARQTADKCLQEAGQLDGSLAEFNKALSERLYASIDGDRNPARTDLTPIAAELIRVAGELRE